MFDRSRAVLVPVLVAALAVVAAPSARAQVPGSTATAPVAVAATPAPAPVGPAVALGASGVRANYVAISREDALRSASAQGTLSRGEVLMIVGGAALLTGLIIGDDAGTLIAVGGAVVGLYGLYLWLPSKS